MGKCYCDYCDVFLTHDSVAVRKQHNDGNRHRQNVCEYYRQFVGKEGQDKVDTVVAEFECLVAKGLVCPTFGLSVINGVINGVSTTGKIVGYGQSTLFGNVRIQPPVVSEMSSEKHSAPIEPRSTDVAVNFSREQPPSGGERSPKRQRVSLPEERGNQDHAEKNMPDNFSPPEVAAVSERAQIENGENSGGDLTTNGNGRTDAQSATVKEGEGARHGATTYGAAIVSESNPRVLSVPDSPPPAAAAVATAAVEIVEAENIDVATPVIANEGDANGSDMDMEMDDE
jgi:U1 zinc finger